MKKSNMNKKERSELKRKNLEQSQIGEGLFLFQNKSNQATLQLPKVSYDGKKWIEPNHTWKGDSFFLKMVPREAILLKTIISPDEQRKEKEKVMTENKLLLDQPDQITQDGKVEHVVASNEVELNESSKKRKKKKNESTTEDNSLLTEDPIAGVTIIRD